MIKKKIMLVSLIFFLSNCGFTPIYLKNTDVNFSIEQINYTGDTELNNFLKTNLKTYKNDKINNKIYIKANSIYQKIIFEHPVTKKLTTIEQQIGRYKIGTVYRSIAG